MIGTAMANSDPTKPFATTVTGCRAARRTCPESFTARLDDGGQVTVDHYGGFPIEPGHIVVLSNVDGKWILVFYDN